MDIGILMLLFVPYLLLCMIPSYMAEKRGRSGIGWFFLSIFVTPFWAAPVILCLGETDEKHKERIFQEEEWRILCRKLYSNKNNDEN